MKRVVLLLALLLAVIPALAEGDLPGAAEFAGEHFPDYACISGCADEEYCSFLMRNPSGATVFVGGVWMDGGWVFTESMPLPEGTVMDSYHSGSSSFIFSFPHPAGAQNSGDEPVWINVAAYPQQDGRWLVRTISNENENGFHIDEEGLPGYYVNHTGVIFGTVTFERDMRMVDWGAFPLSLEEALNFLADDMGVIGVRTLPLYVDAARTAVIAEYRYATPVTILARQGGMVQVRIADSEVNGWVEERALLLGAEQLIPDIDNPAWDTTPEWYADYIRVPEGTVYYDGPEGTALGVKEYREEFTLMAICGDWCHVCWPESLESGWVRVADGEVVAWADHLPVPEGCTLLEGWTGLKTAMHLMEKPDGAIVLACFVRNEGGWTLTESTPLPAGLSYGLDDFHAGEGGVCVYMELPEERRAYEDVSDLMIYVDLQADGAWTVTGVNTGMEVIAFCRHGVYDDLGYPFYGDLLLERDVTRLDWAALPPSFEQAMVLVDTSRWAIVTRDGASVQAEDGSVLLAALEGAPVTILALKDGRVHVAFMDSSVTGWMAAEDLLLAAGQMRMTREEGDVWWENLHCPAEYIPEDERVTRYGVLHDETTTTSLAWDHVEYITLLGRCPEGCCLLMYREAAGEVAWISADGLNAACGE